MKIKQEQSFIFSRWLGLFNSKVFLVLLVISLYPIVGALSIYLYKNDYLNRLKEGIIHFEKTTGHYIESFSAKPEIIKIDMKHKNFMKIAYQREISMKLGRIIKGEDSYVPAKITHNGKIYNVKMRLKGDKLDHISTSKWSYRVKVKNDETIFGMKKFSIQHPMTRSYIYAWIFNEFFKREGMISPRYDFIRVFMNGKDMGIYALEEHFDKILIEHNGYREGPVFKFDDTIYWQASKLSVERGGC